MAFLTIDAVAIDILTESASEQEPERIGDTQRAFSGNLRTTVRARKRVFEFTAGPKTEAAYATLMALDDGLPHACSGDAMNGATLSCLVQVNGGEYIADGLSHQRLPQLRLVQV